MTQTPERINGGLSAGGDGGPAPGHSLAALKGAGRQVLDVLLPPHCLKCRMPVDEPGSLCATCWNAITSLGSPACGVCGLPFEFNAGDYALCSGCIRRRAVYERARSVFAYDDASRDLILGFKHADRTEAAPAFARWLARAAGGMAAEADIVAPVPLHWTRFWRRRYNQSAILASALARRLDKPVIPDLLMRVRRTPPQGGLGGAGRYRKVRGVLKLTPRFADRVRGWRVLLIDDVYTAGATAEACARVLLRGGAGAVDLLTLARVVRPGNQSEP
ncbi:MAG: ComF family protein [Rhodospirillaceae bacterium]